MQPKRCSAALAAERFQVRVRSPRGIVYETRICIVSLRSRFSARRGLCGSAAGLPRLGPFVSRVEEEGQDEGRRSCRVPSESRACCTSLLPLRALSETLPDSPLSSAAAICGARSKERRGPRRAERRAAAVARCGPSPRRLRLSSGLFGSGVLQLIAHETKSNSHSLSGAQSQRLSQGTTFKVSKLAAVESESSKYANFVSTNLVSMDCQCEASCNRMQFPELHKNALPRQRSEPRCSVPRRLACRMPGVAHQQSDCCKDCRTP